MGALISEDFPSGWLLERDLLPACRQNLLHLLRLGNDALIPREAVMIGAELRHRLDQPIDLRAEQRLPIACLNGFHLRRRRRAEPEEEQIGVTSCTMMSSPSP